VNPDAASAAREAVQDIARASYGRLVAYLSSVTGDLAAAEDALSDAFLAALRTWPERGVPVRPDSWLVTAARRTLIDAARRRAVADRGLPEIARLLQERSAATDPASIPDKRLELMFACTHPVIDAAMRAPLMLQTVLGLDAARIGGAFLVEDILRTAIRHWPPHAVAPDVLTNLSLDEVSREAANAVLANAQAAMPTAAEIKQLLAEGAARAAAQVEALEAALPAGISWEVVSDGVRDVFEAAARARSAAKRSPCAAAASWSIHSTISFERP